MPNNSTISQIVLGSGDSAVTYDIKDAKARQDIAALEAYTDYLGVTTTVLTEGATTNPITINGESVTAKNGNIVNYQAKEFIFNGTAWQEFGDLSGLGKLAFVDEATGAYTPAGSVAAPTFTGSEMTSTGSFTPAGSVAASWSFNISDSATNVYSITDVGSLPSFSVSGEVLTFDPGSLPTKGPAQAVTVASSVDIDPELTRFTFTGTAGSVSVTGTPEGTNSAPAFTGAAATIKVGVAD